MNEAPPEEFCWQAIRLTECEDDYQFQANPLCKKWVQHLASHIVKELGASPRIRMFSYKHNRYTLLAVDIYAADDQSDTLCVNITIFLTGKSIELSAPAGNQFDIALPGIMDALNLVASLRSLTQNEEPDHQWRLWIA